jgi:hypothetical protein
VRLDSEDNELAELISMNAVEWTAIVKVKAIAGIVLSLRFAPRLGLIHSYLMSKDIFFDVNHDSQFPDCHLICLTIADDEKNPLYLA